MDADEKKTLLGDEFDIPMTRKMEDDIMAMANTKYGFEVEAEIRLLCRMVKDKVLTTAEAAAYANLSEEKFLDEIQEYDTNQAAASPARAY